MTWLLYLCAAGTFACFAIIAICARREVRDMDAETAAMWAEACPWPAKDDGPSHNDGATIL